MKDQALREKLIEAADQCVKCGFCLPHCPTYRTRREEAESPRGRISLIQGLASGQLDPSPALTAHLSSCLECRACEVACPSLVSFGPLMDGARALQVREAGAVARALRKARLQVLSSRWGTDMTAAICRFYRAIGLGRLMEYSAPSVGSTLRAVHRLAMQLGQVRRPPAAATAGHGLKQELALFLGCIARATQPGLATAACRVLERLGFQVVVPGAQFCCGALHRHNGFPEEADRLLAKNTSAFAGRITLTTASACAVELRSQANPGDVREICRFLADSNWPEDALRPLRARIAVHEPCSHRNALRDTAAATDLLRKIPGVELLNLEGNAFCCGAAGTYLVDNAPMSATLLAPKIEALRRLGRCILVTTNTGCALHLAAGAREARMDLEVLHPVEIIARQLAD